MATALLPEPNVLIPQLAAMAPVMRRSIDAKIGLPTTPQSLFSWVTHLNGRGHRFTAQGILVTTNLVPAAIPRADYFWAYTSRSPRSDGMWPGSSLGEETTKFIRDQRTLMWDTEGGAATVRALVQVLTGEITVSAATSSPLQGNQKKPPPSWLVAALDALNAGESWVLSKNRGEVQRAQEAVAAWLPESTWFGYKPTTSDRNRVSAAISELGGKLLQGQAQSALSLDAYLTAAAGAGASYIPPPSVGWSMWQKIAAGAGIVGAAWGGMYWWKTRDGGRKR